jgi:hypothetical protein
MSGQTLFVFVPALSRVQVVNAKKCEVIFTRPVGSQGHSVVFTQNESTDLRFLLDGEEIHFRLSEAYEPYLNHAVSEGSTKREP